MIKNKMMTLHQTENDKTVLVKKITAVGGMRRRLQDLGFVEGNFVDILNTGALGDPTAYRINGTVIALRKEDADSILVEDIKNV